MIEFDNARRRLVVAAGAGFLLSGAASAIVHDAEKKSEDKDNQLDEMGELFEETEHKQFCKDGFEDAVAQITRVEEALGIADIAQFTPPPPNAR